MSWIVNELFDKNRCSAVGGLASALVKSVEDTVSGVAPEEPVKWLAPAREERFDARIEKLLRANVVGYTQVFSGERSSKYGRIVANDSDGQKALDDLLTRLARVDTLRKTIAEFASARQAELFAKPQAKLPSDGPYYSSYRQFGCSGCSGRGLVRCRTCAGHGDLTCLHCRHGKAECGVCHGRGQYHDGVNGYRRCGSCGNSGRQFCGYYSGTGKVRCGSCAGGGALQCGTCDGAGLLTRMWWAEIELSYETLPGKEIPFAHELAAWAVPAFPVKNASSTCPQQPA